MKFVIDRSKWLRGQINSVLLRVADGKQCCIGQVACQLGADLVDLRGASTLRELLAFAPSSLHGVRRLLVRSCGEWVEKDWVDECYAINDERSYSDAQREHFLATKFLENGHELVFVDSTPTAAD